MEHIQKCTNYWFLKPYDNSYHYIRIQVEGSDNFYWRKGYKRTDGNISLLSEDIELSDRMELEKEFQQEYNYSQEDYQNELRIKEICHWDTEENLNLKDYVGLRAKHLLETIFDNKEIVYISDVVNYIRQNNFEKLFYNENLYRCIMKHRNVGIVTHNEIMEYVEPFINRYIKQYGKF